jgi:hypothetical protein
MYEQTSVVPFYITGTEGEQTLTDIYQMHMLAL